MASHGSSSRGDGISLTDNSKGNGSLSSNSGTIDGASKTSSTPNSSNSFKPWLFALILILGGLMFYLLKRKNRAGNNSRNAKAMNLFVKYSE
jgi:hypothetical protein